jgi:hypothetical protein
MAELNEITSPELIATIRQRIQNDVDLQNTLSTDPKGGQKNSLGFIRVPFAMTCNTWEKRGEYLLWSTNPGSVTWNLSQRVSEQKNRMGTVQHVWKDNYRDTYFDEPVLDISFQSGSLYPVRNVNGEFEISSGLSNFYKFLQLVDEDKLDDYGRANMVHIMYTSGIFPSMTLSGTFTSEGLSWTDTADDPFNISDWRARFIVKSTSPKINRKGYSQLISSFNSAIKSIPIKITYKKGA